ncbi:MULTISPECIES: hypothetical protein [unclassified Herbaspirillum]|uniref:hypothetical protein n=1 Tax=unclassified Herbaspirillum TaxID=2624150 RepID=UPI000E2F6A8F|nr:MULTISPECIES: hypothetical protein [unclassified Herbaspirillum]RFB70835.1 hypothetical protein DZB54_09390 [Herbaspirillum sp. 3R-3a1]TFI08640.1 hypothetical protein E4P32_10865 [Herbaspirillum sp. 3R11]TFI15055.1 hypothetical protein E4P31_10860 [Herbaspirillum sp. 3R-11]TFI29756.1 hypothetical protein E4P30_05680 [Herbaspirillum sp. 3C11]
MINATKGEVVIIQSGKDLQRSVVAALQEASSWILQSYGLQDIALNTVSTKTHFNAALPAFAQQFILKQDIGDLNERYVKDVFDFISIETGHCSPTLYAAVTRIPADDGGIKGYRKTYLPPLRRGFSAFLISLHIRRAIILPFSFKWPLSFDLGYKGAILAKREVCPLEHLPELFRFIRSLNCLEDGEQSEKVFEAYTTKQRERLVWMGQRLIVAGGWLELTDVNYGDMLSLKAANDETGFSGNSDLGLLMLADLFERKYGSASPVTAAGWRAALDKARPQRNFIGLEGLIGGRRNLLEETAKLNPADMAPNALEYLTSLPGLEFDLKANSETWIRIQHTFLRKIRLESKKQRIAALGYLNIYLFGYLPYWYAENPGVTFEFPSAPDKLLSAVFISDLGLMEGQLRPLPIVEFFDKMAPIRKWEVTTHYAVLKQIEKLFEFIERHNEALPNSKGFRQPLFAYDYPAQSRSTGTTKRPIPRRIFKFYVSYVEALATLSSVLTQRVVSGVVSNDGLKGFGTSQTTIDCLERQDVLGFVPIVFYQGKMYPLRHIPNIFNIDSKRLKNGHVSKVPHPHAIHQILVSLYTGLRHNHIQWLDNATFDQLVDDEHGSREFAELHVNTDKTKTKPWTPYVNFKVIEVLRQQRDWRALIDERGFESRIYYNNNPESKWGDILPLFSHHLDGRPHSDEMYQTCWMRLLNGLQGELGTVGEHGFKLTRLLPKGVAYNDPDMDKKLHTYGSIQTRICDLSIKSDITPHSARVSVISHSIGILPADLIGRHWTGQTEATVYHYVVPDKEEIFAEQRRQQLAIRQMGYEKGYEAMLRASPGRSDAHIKADDINSNLSKGLRTNVDETLSAFGCISLSFTEGGKTGMDVLKDTRGVGAIENKTEICPYANQCPPNVVTELKGWRRCGPCSFAVRSVDHLPAITAKIRQVLEGLVEIESRIMAVDGEEDLTADELDSLEQTRDTLAEDLAAWQMAAEVLEVMRQRIATGESTKSWHVQKPEIIEKDLRRALFPTDSTEYVLARLQESETFPILESPQIRARFDLLRRQLLVNTGNVRAALRFEPSTNPGAECLGLLRSIIAAHRLTLADLKIMLESDSYLESIPIRPLKLVTKGIA